MDVRWCVIKNPRTVSPRKSRTLAVAHKEKKGKARGGWRDYRREDSHRRRTGGHHVLSQLDLAGGEGPHGMETGGWRRRNHTERRNGVRMRVGRIRVAAATAARVCSSPSPAVAPPCAVANAHSSSCSCVDSFHTTETRAASRAGVEVKAGNESGLNPLVG